MNNNANNDRNHDLNNMFRELGGTHPGGMPALHADVHATMGGTLYLQKPGVAMLARPQTSLEGMRGFLDGFRSDLEFDDYPDDPHQLSDAAQICKTAGQLCYASFSPRRTTNENADKYFSNIIGSNHGSVLEHASFSFLLYGISRSVTHELVRHRVGVGVSQVSQRYVSGSVLRFVERPEYSANPTLHEQFCDRIERSADEYETLAATLLDHQERGAIELDPGSDAARDARKRVQQTARSILPNETEAPTMFTTNIRSLRHILRMRASSHAEVEIRNLATRMLLCAHEVEPVLFGDMSLRPLKDGTYELDTPE